MIVDELWFIRMDGWDEKGLDLAIDYGITV